MEQDMLEEQGEAEGQAIMIKANGDGTFAVMAAPVEGQEPEPQMAKSVDEALDMVRGMLGGDQSEDDMRAGVAKEVYGEAPPEPPGELARPAMRNGQARRFG